METIHIVIVEDEEPEAIKIKDMLNKLGCNVRISSGEEAFQKNKGPRADLVILCTSLKGTSSLADAVRRLQDTYETSVVLLQSCAEKDCDFCSKPVGLAACLQKPVSLPSIKKIIDIVQHQKNEQNGDHGWWSTALSNIAEAVIKLDADGKIVYLNAVAKNFIPGAAQEAMGRDFASQFQIYDAATNRLIQNPFEYVLYQVQSARHKHLTHLLDRTGEKIYFEMTGLPLFDGYGKIPGMLLILHDVTKIIQGESKILALQEKYRRHQEESLTGNFIASIDGSIYYCNSVFVRLMGFATEREIKQHKLYEFYPSKKSFYWQTNRLQKKKVLRSYKSIWKDRKGRTIFVIEKLVGQFADGKLQEIRGHLFDITEYTKTERQLHHAQKMESIGTMAGGIAHDFNNMLGSILGYASFMKTSLPDEHPFYKYLDTIEKSATRASELTGRLLTFARDVTYERVPLNLNNLVAEVISIIQSSMDRSIEIITNLDQEIPTIEADSGGLVQVVMNICLNARDAMPDGGSLTIQTGTEEIKKNSDPLASEEKAKYVVLSLKDTGLGMDYKTMQKAFEPFYTTKNNGKNSGLGLSTVYGIVKQMDGFIKVDSKVGNGTEFRIYLPASGKPLTEIEQKYDTDIAGTEVILVIDDDSSVRNLATDILHKFGYKVLLAENGMQAIAQYKKHWQKIDLVILDIVMPKMSGEETFKQLKQINRDVKVLLTSGYNLNNKMQKLFDQGAHEFLQKPYHFHALLAKIRKILAKDQDTTLKTSSNKIVSHV